MQLVFLGECGIPQKDSNCVIYFPNHIILHDIVVLNIVVYFLGKYEMTTNEKISDLQIISMLMVDHLLAWEQLYDQYAAPMYGLICALTDDKILAEEIFMDAFVQLKERKVLENTKTGLAPVLLGYTFSHATKHLKEIGIIPKSLLQVIGRHLNQSSDVTGVVPDSKTKA